MQNHFPLSTVSILTVTICFILYYFIIHSEKIHQYFIKKDGLEKSKSTWIISQRLIGFFFYGIIPLVFIQLQNLSLEDIGISISSKEPIFLWIIGLSLVCIIINYFACKKEDHLKIYPQIKTPHPWSNSLTITSSLTLVIYTLGYEIMFRGYLLLTCEKELGIILAIVINTVIYALAHIPKGWKETVGAFPMGIILCWLTIKTGNIWIAVFVHIMLALSSEWFSIAEHKKRLKTI